MTCSHRTMTNEFEFNKGKPIRIAWCRKKKNRIPLHQTCRNPESCPDYSEKDPTAQTTLEGGH